MIDILGAIALGFVFGWMLHKAGLTRYARIAGVFRLEDLTVLRFMLAALAVAAVAIRAADDLGFATALPVPPTAVAANLIGGLLFGAGMASAGLCTGTVVAQAAEGRLDALLAGIPGLVAGAIAFGLIEPAVMPSLARVGALGRATAATLTHGDPDLVLLVFLELVALVLYATRPRESRRARPLQGPGA